MFRSVLISKGLSRLLASSVVFPLVLAAGTIVDQERDNGVSGTIITRYLIATRTSQNVDLQRPMMVDIDAQIPKLKEQGRLHALRQISKVGKITYRVLGFQGDNTVKKEVIARYLTAEQQAAQGQNRLAVTPANYKFRFRGRRTLAQGGNVYIFGLEPREKKVGLFKGEVWLDADTCLPVFQRGRFVKNPSIFFKRVDFERAFAIRDGVSVPEHMNSTINTRLIGKVELNVNYTDFSASKAVEMPVNSSVNSSGASTIQ